MVFTTVEVYMWIAYPFPSIRTSSCVGFCMKLDVVSELRVLSSSPGLRNLIKIVGSPPLCPRIGIFSIPAIPLRLTRCRSIPVGVGLSKSQVRGGVEVYMWIAYRFPSVRTLGYVG